MQLSKERTANSPARRPWARIAFCLLLLVAFGGILHDPVPAQAHASALQMVAVSDGADLCEPGHAAVGGHCHLTSACSLCGLIGTAVAVRGKASTHPLAAVATPAAGGVVDPRLHPPMPAGQA